MVSGSEDTIRVADREMKTAIPLVDLWRQHQALEPELTAEFQQVVRASAFIRGRYVERFEQEFAAFCGARSCAGVANGTDALVLTLRALGLQAGDEVVVPTMTFAATAEAVSLAGGRVRFADVDPETLLVTPATLMAALTPATRMVIPVHLYGNPVDVEAVDRMAERAGVAVVYDAAQAHGARWNGKPVTDWGSASTFSFYPGKNLGALGDAGAVVANDAALVERIRVISDHGRRAKYEHAEVGTNSRLDAIQAAFLRVKLKHLGDWNAQRRKAAARYQHLLSDLGGIRTLPVPGEAHHVYHLYVVRVGSRDEARAALNAKGIGCGVHYPIPLHLQRAFAHLGYSRGEFPVSERAVGEILSLPLFPGITEDEQQRVVDALRDALD